MIDTFWLAIAIFCFMTIAIDIVFRIVQADVDAPPPEDPYRLERWKAGEPLDPDQNP